MRNIALALVIGVAVAAALALPGWLKVAEAAVPGVLALLVAYFLLARATFKKVEVIFMEGQGALASMPPKFDLAVATLEKAYAYGRAQLGVRTQTDTQIGMILFLKQEFAKAAPYLQRSLGFGHWMGAAMLGVIQYKRKDHEGMRKTLEIVTRKGKKQALVWCLYAYLLQQIGDREGAQQVLARGLKGTKDDARVKEALLAVQNNKKIKMRAFKEQWYQFHLERPPADLRQAQVPMRVGKIARRGRW